MGNELESVSEEFDWDNWLNIGIHHGNINSYRSHVFGQDLDKALWLGFINRDRREKIKRSKVLVSSKFYSEIQNGVSSESIQELNPFDLSNADKIGEKEKITLKNAGFKRRENV